MNSLIKRIKNIPPAELVLWSFILFTVILLASAGAFLFRNPAPAERTTVANVGSLPSSPTPTAVATPSPEEVAPSSPTPSLMPIPTPVELQLPEITPPPDGQVYVVTPAANAVGWVRQGDGTPNHFGDYNIYAGAFEGQMYIGALQFDLSEVPMGAPITYADLTLVGLSDHWLSSGGTWRVELLEPGMEENWTQ